MTENMFRIISLVADGLILIGLVAFVVSILHRQPQGKSREQESPFAGIIEDQQRLIQAIQPIVATSPSLDNVVTRLTFTQSLDSEQFAIASQESALFSLNMLLDKGIVDGVSVTVNSVRLLPSGSEIKFTCSKEGQRMLDEGTAVLSRNRVSGKYLPLLKDARTGEFIEQLKGVPVNKIASQLGNMSVAVIGAAHIIAGADIAKRLHSIESEMNLLLAYRCNDQMAKLERIYASAKELSCGPMNQDKCWELWRLRGELRELRCTWRHELQYHLNLIEDPDSAPWLKRMFPRQKSIDINIHTKITDGQLQAGLIEYSLRLDQVLAVGSGTVPEFEVTLSGELQELEMVASLLQSKAGLISGKYKELSVEPMAKAMTAMVEQYRRLLPNDSGSGPALLPEPGGWTHADD